MAARILFHTTHGEADAERATVPFIAATVAATSGQSAAVVCTADAVWIGTDGGTDRVEHPGMPPLRQLYGEFVAAGGEIWLCSACTSIRDITEERLATGARIVGAAEIVAAVVDGAMSVTLT